MNPHGPLDAHPPRPLVFAVDASGRTAGVCVQRGGEILFQRVLDEGLTHSETLLPLVDEAFRSVGLQPRHVDLFAVTAGPGSFTGLRIGMALVKGLALPCGTPLAAVSTLLAIARGCRFEGRVAAALNARRGEVYWGLFRRQGDGFCRLLPDAAEPAASLAEQLAFDGTPLCFAGDGAELCLEQYAGRPGVAPRPACADIARGAAAEALTLWQRGEIGSSAEARPIYLRLSQAERERMRRLEQEKP